MEYFGLFDVIRGGDIRFEVTTNETNFYHRFKRINLADFICILEKPYKILMYSNGVDDSTEGDLKELSNYALYGDMLVEVNYRTNYYRYGHWSYWERSQKPLVDISILPLIILDKTQDIEIPLDRSFINLPEYIVTQIENEYSRLNLPKYLEELDSICENSMPIPDYYSGRSMEFRDMLANWYVKSGKVYLPIYDTNIFYILSNRVDEVIHKVFNDKGIITTSHISESITNISDSIEHENIVALSRNYIEENLIKIRNHNVGFRGEAIRMILNQFCFVHEDFENLESASKIKDFIINHSTELKEFFNSLYENNILWFDESYKGSSLILKDNDYLYITKRKLEGNGNIDILKDIFQKNTYKNIMLDEGEST